MAAIKEALGDKKRTRQEKAKAAPKKSSKVDLQVCGPAGPHKHLYNDEMVGKETIFVMVLPILPLSLDLIMKMPKACRQRA